MAGKDLINGYSLSNEWFEFVLDNPDKVTGNHTALYMWLVQINNRVKWRTKFQVTTRENMDGMACKSRTTYHKCFDNLVEWGFITVVQKSSNQYQCNVISLYKKCTTTSTSTDTTIDTTTSTITGTIHKLIKLINLENIDSINDIENFNTKHFKSILIHLGGNESHVEDWMKVRKDKKASNTKTSLKQFLNECKKHNYPVSDAVKICAERGWKGFKFEWLNETDKSTSGNPQNQKLISYNGKDIPIDKLPAHKRKEYLKNNLITQNEFDKLEGNY